jgi:hypothetical protein
MRTLRSRSSVVVSTASAAALLASLVVAVHGATAQAAGTVTGQVRWGPCLRAIPLPAADAQSGQPATTQPTTPELMPAPGRPVPAPINGLPAGAVLVAVQNTSISARTDEAGRFSLAGVPAGQYLTVAAGPVANAVAATASRPNVFVNGGQTLSLGTLSLGGTTQLGIACRGPLATLDGSPGAAPGDADPEATEPAGTPNP